MFLRDLGRVRRNFIITNYALRRRHRHVDRRWRRSRRPGRAQRGLLRRSDLRDRRWRLQPALRLRHRHRFVGGGGAGAAAGAAMASAGAFDGKVFYVGGDDDFFPAAASSTTCSSTTSLPTRGATGRRCRWRPSAGRHRPGRRVPLRRRWLGRSAHRRATSTPPSATTCRATRGRPDRSSRRPGPTWRLAATADGPLRRSPVTTTAVAFFDATAPGRPARPRQLAEWRLGGSRRSAAERDGQPGRVLHQRHGRR